MGKLCPAPRHVQDDVLCIVKHALPRANWKAIHSRNRGFNFSINLGLAARVGMFDSRRWLALQCVGYMQLPGEVVLIGGEDGRASGVRRQDVTTANGEAAMKLHAEGKTQKQTNFSGGVQFRQRMYVAFNSLLAMPPGHFKIVIGLLRKLKKNVAHRNRLIH